MGFDDLTLNGGYGIFDQHPIKKRPWGRHYHDHMHLICHKKIPEKNEGSGSLVPRIGLLEFILNTVSMEASFCSGSSNDCAISPFRNSSRLRRQAGVCSPH
jgi:hypothetical protein